MFRHGVALPGGDSTTDCCLRTTDGGEFRAQRGFLCASSAYFQALFGEQYGWPRDVVVSGVRGPVLDVLLTYLYTEQLLISARNVLEVLQAADMLLLDGPRELCLQLLLKNMAPDNCLGLAALTRRYPCPKFTDAVMTYALLHFDKAWRCTEDFGNTPAWLLYYLLASPQLNISREGDALEAIARWYSATEHKNSFMLQELLRCVRVGLCQPDALDAFRQRWPALAARAEFQEAINHALELGPCMGTRNSLLRRLRELEKPSRIPLLPNLITNPFAGRVAPVLTGAGVDALNAVATAATAVAAAAAEAADEARHEAAHPAAPMLLTQAQCQVCGMANPERWLPRLPTELIFVVGGWCDGRTQSTIESFDFRVNRWFKFSNYKLEPRAYHGLVQWKRRLFVVGGICQEGGLFSRPSYLSSVASLDLDSCKWSHHYPMHVARGYVAVAALGDHIYAIGGHTGVERTRTAERYDPFTNQWTMVADMNRRRSDGSACAWNGRIFISGGFSGSHFLESVEMYTPALDSWSLVQSLPSPRCSHRMVQHCGRIYIIGGFNGLLSLNTVISSENSLPLRWREMPSLTIPRRNFAVAHLGDDLYVIGGNNGTSLVADVERYTPGEESWCKAKPLNTPSGAFGACTVQGLKVCGTFSARGLTLPLHVTSLNSAFTF